MRRAGFYYAPMPPRRPARLTALATTLASLAALPLVAACQPDEPPPPPARPTQQSLDDLKAAFRQTDPSVQVGDVVEVLADDPFLTAAGLGSVAEGDVVTVVDADTAIVAQGTVASASGDFATVRFTAPDGAAFAPPAAEVESDDAPVGPRRPEVGDLVLRYPPN